jgi:DNA adenine methylase
MAMIKPILKYPGAKWMLAPRIASLFPSHKRYVEPYCGSAAVFFAKEPAEHEILNDLYGCLINFFTVLRDHPQELARRIDLTPWSEEEYRRCEQAFTDSPDPIENARRFMVRCWQAHGTRFRSTAHRQGWRHNGLSGHQYPALRWQGIPDRLLAAAHRLKDAELRCRPAMEMIRYYNTPDTLLYIDPPYLRTTRNDRYYVHEMSDRDHLALLEALEAHQGPVVLSGYAHPLYDERLGHWQRVELVAIAEHGKRRTEVLWLNRACGARQLPLFGVI